jgi:S-methylmethionine-dependent homocysteine/selenocysteine methylase
MIWVKEKLTWMIIIFFLFNIQCVKYSFKGALPSYLKTISIPLFEDNTSWAGLREDLTTQVIDAFINDNTLQVVEDEGAADLLLEGTITRIQEKYVAISQEENIEEKQIWVYVSVKCINQKMDKELWSGSVSDYDVVTGAGTLEELNRAISDATKKIVEDIINKTIAAW